MKYRFPFDLVSISPLSHILLNIGSKDELLDLCDDYQIACTKSMNKTDLADRIEATLLKHPEQFARCLPLSDLLALKKIVQAGGVLQSKEPLITIALESQMLVLSPSETPIKGKKTETVFWYAIAQNLQNVLKPIINRLVADPKLKVLDKNERTLLGFLRLYGILTEATLRDIWEKTTKELLDPYDLIQLFRTRILLKQEFKPFYADNKLCFASTILDFPWELYEKIKKRSDLEYAQYPIDVVLSYADSPLYSKNTKVLLSLIQWLKDKNEGDNMLTALQLGVIWESVQTGEKMTELMQKILETSQWGSIQELNELMLRLTEYTNDTPHWILKGHTPSDLHATQNPINLQDPNFRRNLNEQLKQQYPDANPHQMWRELDEALPPGNVGRNDPCPCGSGKKYKKCCGAN